VICRCLHIATKGAIVNSVNSEVSGPNVTKIVHNVEKFILSNLLKSKLRYCNPFPNGSATKVDWSIKSQFFEFNLLPWQRPLMNQKRGPDRLSTNKYLSFGAKNMKICPVRPPFINIGGTVDREIICLRAIIKKRKKKDISAAKYIARSAT